MTSLNQSTMMQAVRLDQTTDPTIRFSPPALINACFLRKKRFENDFSQGSAVKASIF